MCVVVRLFHTCLGSYMDFDFKIFGFVDAPHACLPFWGLLVVAINDIAIFIYNVGVFRSCLVSTDGLTFRTPPFGSSDKRHM